MYITSCQIKREFLITYQSSMEEDEEDMVVAVEKDAANTEDKVQERDGETNVTMERETECDVNNIMENIYGASVLQFRTVKHTDKSKAIIINPLIAEEVVDKLHTMDKADTHIIITTSMTTILALMVNNKTQMQMQMRQLLLWEDS